jgi:peptidoglycan/xylan/chitin deacetylase (PgdA/CDA1 family)
MASVFRWADEGRALHILFFMDNLEGFDESGIGGWYKDDPATTSAIRNHIKTAKLMAEENGQFKSGITLVVGCGVGRGMMHEISLPKPENWEVDFLSAHDFERLLDGLEERTKIVGPEEFAELLGKPSETDSAVMLSFDDSLRYQYEVAAPILKARKIRAGFAIYSSIYTGEPDPLEIFAEFRESHFERFHDFLNEFLSVASQQIRNLKSLAANGVEKGFLEEFPFYSYEEKLFRFVRDVILTADEYKGFMWQLIDQANSFNPEAVARNLWMEVKHLRTLVSEGHTVGLHSHSHPTRMDLVPKQGQIDEYTRNFSWIEEHLKVTPDFVAHPCGRYSPDTLQVMAELGIRYGFRSSMSELSERSQYEIPRQDASNLVMESANFAGP